MLCISLCCFNRLFQTDFLTLSLAWDHYSLVLLGLHKLIQQLLTPTKLSWGDFKPLSTSPYANLEFFFRLSSRCNKFLIIASSTYRTCKIIKHHNWNRRHHPKKGVLLHVRVWCVFVDVNKRRGSKTEERLIIKKKKTKKRETDLVSWGLWGERERETWKSKSDGQT